MITLQNLLKQAKGSFPDMASAEFFLRGLTNKKRCELYLDKTSVTQEIANKFRKLLRARKPAMPVQYLLHKAYFLSYELYVDERVLIPRFETEDLVMNTIARLKTLAREPKSIIDIGTGSGAIAIALADVFPHTKIFATDISRDAIEVAKINVKRYNYTERIKLYQVDLIPGCYNERFDLIISNPPYVPNNEIANLNSTVKDYEPQIALDGGKQGFEIIDRIIKEANEWLSPAGLLALEIDPRQAELIKTKVPRAEFEKDNQGSIRYVFIKYESYS